MRVRGGPLVAEGVDEHQLIRRVGEVLLTADDVRDLHQRVVDWARELIGGVAVRLHDDEIADQPGVELHLPADHVGEGDLTARDLEAHSENRAALRRVGQAAARIDVWPLLHLRLFALGLQLFGRAVAAIGLAVLEQARRLFLVDVEPVRLAVGLVRTAFVGALVPMEAEPREALEDEELVLGPVALQVGVVDTEHERAVVLARVQHVVESGACGAQVRETRRAGRDPDSY